MKTASVLQAKKILLAHIKRTTDSLRAPRWQSKCVYPHYNSISLLHTFYEALGQVAILCLTFPIVYYKKKKIAVIFPCL